MAFYNWIYFEILQRTMKMAIKRVGRKQSGNKL